MLSVLYAEVNIVGAAFLLFMLTNKNANKPKDIAFDQKIFNVIMFTNLMVLVLDTVMWVIDGCTFTGMRTVNIIISALYYLFCSVMCMLCLIYADYRIFENKPLLIKRLRIYCIPATVSAVMSLASPLTGWFFYIEKENIYTRGNLFFVFVVIAFIYLLAAIGLVIYDIVKNGWAKNKAVDLPLIVFFTAIITATIIQVLYYGISLIWITIALACSYNYINIQNGVISTDYITGLNNRKRLDLHIQRRIQSWRGRSLLFALILDIDNFKQINDVYGHLSGDAALSYAADILRKSCKNGIDFIARMGGDEFIIIGERSNTDEIEQLLRDINENLDRFNGRHILKFDLNVSMGYTVLGKNDTPASFIDSADKNMYTEKQKRKMNRSY